MFFRLTWNVRYNIFCSRWNDNDITMCFKNLKYYQDVRKLVTVIPSSQYNSFYDKYASIPSYYGNFMKWLNASMELRRMIENKQVVTNKSYTQSTLTLQEFVATEDGHEIDFRSAILACVQELGMLVDLLEKETESSKDYIYRHYREVFIDGYVLLGCLFEQVSSV